MNSSRIFYFVIVFMTIVFGLMFLFGQDMEKSLSETCLSLNVGVSQSAHADSGQVNYETYGHLKKPPLSPDEALKKFQLEEGFRIEIVAHEPMVTDPVALDIDADGRLWVVDMPSYMPVHDMNEEETVVREQVPKGRVVVLEDTNGDGRMDMSRVFREGLILPRAIKVLHDGILVGEPPNLWFIRDTTGDGYGDTRDRVSANYGDPSTTVVTSSLPSGLLWGMDNWIHSTGDGAESFQRVDGIWQSRPFKRLGAWGMTQDDWGNLYSASNSWPLQTHLVPYGYSERHPLHAVNSGKNLRIAPNEPLWPAHPTGVNRGYRVGIVTREDGTLRQNTAATAPVIYRGDQFDEAYRGNAFTPEPAGNLIKRLLIDRDPAEIEAQAQFAYEGREFLTSTDERFRPVNVYNSPDGSLYVVDIYRGLFEYVRFITDYLMEYTLENDLHIPVGTFGRIYRIVRDDREIDYKTPKFSRLGPSEVVEYLRHSNGMLRDQAQQVLVQCSPSGIISTLEAMAADGTEQTWTRLHALWTLEGFSRSLYEQQRLSRTALHALDDPHPRIRAAAVRILEPELAGNSTQVLVRFEELVGSEPAPFVRLQMLASLGESDSNTALDLIAAILNEHADSPYFREMALTGVYQREEQLDEILRNEYSWSNERGEEYAELLTSLGEAVQEIPEKDLSHLSEAQLELYKDGEIHYVTCIACHGADGQGISGIGAALAGSEWVEGNPESLVRIVLQGFDGGAAQRGEIIPGNMPRHASMSDEDLAGIMTYIRQSWGNDAPPIGPEEVARIRQETSDRRELWSPEELRMLLQR